MDFTNPCMYVKRNFSFKNYVFDGLHTLPEETQVFLKRTRKTGDCPECKRRRCTIEEQRTRKTRDLDFGGKCSIVFPQAKIRCYCGYRGVEKLDFLDRYSSFTKRFEDYAALLCEKMSLKDVAKLLEIDWKAAKAIDKKYLKKQVQPLSLQNPKKIGVDEVAYEKGHKYLTIVRNLDLRRVIWVGLGRKKETLDSFFFELRKNRAIDIEVTTMDMWDPYIASVKENCPNSDIVFDKFHVSKKVNEALDSVRKKEFAKADAEERKDMKKKRFLILSRQKRLDNKQRETIEDLKRINTPLYEAYLLKEQVLDIFDEKNEHSALVRLGKWVANIEKAGITTYLRVARMIKNYWYGIANYFKYHITNAGAEGFNNKINVIKRRAYGFRDIEYFMLKILQSCGWRPS